MTGSIVGGTPLGAGSFGPSNVRASRNPVTGPSYRDVDVALIRRVLIHAGASIELRAEVFNLFNTPNLGAPNGVAGSAAFGTITTAPDPRVTQLAVKLLF